MLWIFLKNSSKFFQIVFTAAVAGLVILVPAYFAFLDPDWHHDGILFKPAVDVASGLALYRETFSQYGALTTYLQAAAISIFGKHLLVIRLQAAIFLSLSGALLFVIAHRIAPRNIAILSVFIWLAVAPYLGATFLPWSSIYSLFFILLGGWLLGKAVEPDTRRTLGYWLCFFSSFSFSAAFWARQPTGIMLPIMFSLFAILLLDRGLANRRLYFQALAYIVGFFPLTLFFLASFIANDSVHDWLSQSILGASSFTAETANRDEGFVENLMHHLFPRPSFIRGGDGSNLWRILPILTLIIFGCSLTRLVIQKAQTTQARQLLVASLLAIGIWHHYFPVPGTWQIYWGATPMIIVVITGTYQALSPLRLRPILKTVSIVSVMGLLFGRVIYSQSTDALKVTPVSVIEFPTLEGMWVSNQYASKNNFSGSTEEYVRELGKLGRVLNNVRSLDPERPLITLTDDLYLPTVLKENNPGPVTVQWDLLHKLYPNHKMELKLFIESHQPLIEIKPKPWGWGKFGWGGGGLEIRARLGIKDYGMLIQTEYSDSGVAQILAPLDFLTEYEKTFGAE
jgi:hypothetical protein